MFPRLKILALILVLVPFAFAQQSEQRPVIGLALEGGGALGLAHIGVLKWMEEHRVPIDRIDGTSMGALIGALYASGKSPAELSRLATGDAISSVFSLQTPYSNASFRRRQDRRDFPAVVTVGLKNRFGLRNAILDGNGLNEFLNKELFNYNSSSVDFDNLPIPFRCVATDLSTFQPHVFHSGSLSKAVRASVSIPGVFPPVKGPDGDYLVDGGIVDNLPTGVLRDQLHAEVVIAVHLELGKMQPSDMDSIVNVLNRAFSAGVAFNEDKSKKLADIVLDIPTASFSSTDYDKGKQLIDVGYQAAEAHRSQLLRYALSEGDWQSYLDARAARQRPAPGMLATVHVEGGDPGAAREVNHDFKPHVGKPLTAAVAQKSLVNVQADGEYNANYESIVLASAESKESDLLVHLTRAQGGPPFLSIAPSASASTSNITRGEINFRLVDQGLGGFGSELRANARVGYLTELDGEYYRLLTPSGFFVEPRGQILRQPVYIWSNQQRVAERFQQNLVVGLRAGWTIGNSLQLSADWSAINTRWRLETGTGGGPDLNGTGQKGLMRITLDRAASGGVSPDSLRLSFAAGALYHSVASDNAPLIEASFSRTHHIGEKNILGIGADVNSYLRTKVAEPFRFTLGGPLRLSASSFDEYRGTDTVLTRAGFMHRLAALPTGLGQGLYAVIGYEAGEVWSPDQKSFLRQDGVAGFVAATPVGTITVGGSVGDAGRRKIFVSIGHWF
ncbi:MAG: patatin-like phospholipase family protein [Acidobacteriota bacterium]|nr:patatin-like phospholipase family protein [Acidobacteriota bacterium]